MNYLNNEKINETCKVFLESPWSNVGFYSEYLAQSYYYICHSTKLLALAAAYTDENQKSYYRRAIKHISEEDGHQYLAESDLKRLGFKIEDFKENSFTRALWEPQYYKTQRNNTSLLGYILGLECIAVKTFQELHERTLKDHGARVTSFIRVHAEEDPDHVEKAIEEVSRLSLKDQEAVNQNYVQTVEVFKHFVMECEKPSLLLNRGDIGFVSEMRA